MEPDGPDPAPGSKRRRRWRATPWALVTGASTCAAWYAFAALASGCDRYPLSDGLPDVLNCSACHGNTQNAAPPKAANGSVSTSEVGVGAHQAHLKAGRISKPIACAECHEVPADTKNHPNLNGGPAPVVFGSLAKTRGATPAWDRTTERCSNGYCHGATLSGANGRTAPLWTRVDGSQISCTSCHGNPPGGSHPSATNCEVCHTAVVGPGGVIRNLELHVNGTIDVTGHPDGYSSPSLHGADANQGKSDCRSCHGAQLEGGNGVVGCDTCHQQGWRNRCTYCHGGTDNATGAPPLDIFGNSSTTSLGVGAHTAHVTRTAHPTYPCIFCHKPVSDVLSAGHMFDSTPGKSEVIFSNGLSPAGQYSAPGCQNLYCHGNGRTNGAVASFIPGGALGCESCHPTAGLSQSHSLHVVFGCQTCHATVATNSTTINNPDLHVNGERDVSLQAGTWNGTTRTCSQTGGACHAEDIAW